MGIQEESVRLSLVSSQLFGSFGRHGRRRGYLPSQLFGSFGRRRGYLCLDMHHLENEALSNQARSGRIVAIFNTLHVLSARGT